MLSNTSKYGIRAIVYIAGNSKKGEKIGIKKISHDLDLPMPFLAKILQQLVKKGILNSSKGPHGGFSLARNAREIFVAELAKAIDGDDVFHRCVLHDKNCISVDNSRKQCILHDDYVKARYKIEKMFEKKSVQNLVNSARQGEALY
jgi:Rrf2 family protein